MPVRTLAIYGDLYMTLICMRFNIPPTHPIGWVLICLGNNYRDDSGYLQLCQTSRPACLATVKWLYSRSNFFSPSSKRNHWLAFSATAYGYTHNHKSCVVMCIPSLFFIFHLLIEVVERNFISFCLLWGINFQNDAVIQKNRRATLSFVVAMCCSKMRMSVDKIIALTFVVK